MTSTLERDLRPLIENKRWDAVVERLATEDVISEASGIMFNEIRECISFAFIGEYEDQPPPVHVLDAFLKVCPDAAPRVTALAAYCALRPETANDFPAETANFLIEKYPTLFLTSLQRRGQLHFYVMHSIHLAALANACTDVMSFLIQNCPEGAREANHYDALPIHYAAAFNASVGVVNCLIDAYPDGLRHRDETGRLPIHVAAASGKSLEVLNRLIEAYPDGVRQPDKSGFLPIHHAALECSPVALEVIIRLIDAYPEGVQKRGACGQLPIHLAARFQKSAYVFRVLIDAYPASIFLTSYNSGAYYYWESQDFLPSQHAHYNNLSNEVFSYLENEEKKAIVDLARTIVEGRNGADA